MKKIVLFMLIAFAAMQAAAFAENKAATVTLSPFIGGYTYKVDEDKVGALETSVIYGLRGGYNFTRNFGVEAVFHYASAEHFETGKERVDVYNYRLDALYHFMPEQRFVPFIAAGYGAIRNEFPTDDGIVRKTLGAFNYGVGAKFYLSENVALRADVRHLIMHEDWTMHNVEYTAGLTFAFGGEKQAPAAEPAPAPKPVPVVLDTDGDGVLDPNDKCPGTPAGVKVDRDGCPVDSDRDGVADYLDNCPDTPQGVKVDKGGCPLDTDGDGVADYLDKCPGTPKGDKVDLNGCTIVNDADRDGVVDDLDKCPGTPQGVKVDSNGCPVDTDGDGVADYLDKCSGTPQGVKVDSNGCPVDADGDGVPDYLDKCSGTPQGVKVDSYGCPVDSDGDGVPDYLDKCPGTPQGATVDKNGCQCITLKVEFDFNKAAIKPSFHDELKRVGDFLQKNPTVHGVIDGHTDSVGSDAYNLKLSEKRAVNVRKYIVDKFGIAPKRLTAKGHGEKDPIADNGTAEGRQQNRRITATFDCAIAN